MKHVYFSEMNLLELLDFSNCKNLKWSTTTMTTVSMCQAQLLSQCAKYSMERQLFYLLRETTVHLKCVFVCIAILNYQN